jgi:hypothetical protein
MTLKDLRSLDRNDVLNWLGLQRKQSTAGWIAASVGLFGAGLLVGAGAALLVAPKTGRDLREDLRGRFKKAQEDLDQAASVVRDDARSNTASKTY